MSHGHWQRGFFTGIEASWPCGWFDPAARTVMVGAVVKGGLMVAPLERPTERTLLPLGKVTEAYFGPVVAFDSARGDVFAICSRAQGHRLRVWRASQAKVVSLGEVDDVVSLAFDAQRRRLVGLSLFETSVRHPGVGWSTLASGAGKGTQLAWDPVRRALLWLELDPDHHGQMRLSVLKRSRWVVAKPRVSLPGVHPDASLACLPDGSLLLHGGGRDIHSLWPESTVTYVSDGMHDFQKVYLAEQPQFGRTCSLVSAVDAPLAIADHSHLNVTSLTREGWQQVSLSELPPVMHGLHDDRSTVFASAPGGVIYELDDDGGLWRANPGGQLQQVTDAAQGPGPRHSGYHAIAYDALQRGLVLFGGSGRNDTWLFDESTNTWRELLSSPRPPHGFPALCSTPDGVYLFVSHELWRLAGERWQCVGHDPAWTTWVLFCDPLRRALWSASEKKLAVWQQGQFREVTELPRGVSICPYPFERTNLVGLDPLGDRLVAWTRTGAHVLPLSSLGVAADGQLPAQAMAPPTERRTTVPRQLLRTAARLVPSKDQAPATKVPGVRVPSGYRLLAVVPRLPAILPLPDGVSGLAVMVPEDAFEAYEHTRVVQLTGVPPSRAWLREGANLWPCELLEFQEIDPIYQEDFDTLPGHQFDHAFQTKVGGFGRFVQDDPRPKCQRCQTPMRLALQLGYEVFMVGDMGETYAYFCPQGCGAGAVLQTH